MSFIRTVIPIIILILQLIILSKHVVTLNCLIKKYFSFLFANSNLILFFMVEFEIFSLVIMSLLLTIIPIASILRKAKKKKRSKNIVNESSIDKEVIESLFDQFSSSVLF